MNRSAPSRLATVLQLLDGTGAEALKRIYSRYPGIHRCKPETVADRARAHASLLGLDLDAFLGLAAQFPPLLTLSLAQRLHDGAQQLGIPVASFVARVRCRPALVGLNSGRMTQSISDLALALGVSPDRMRQACLREPQLLARAIPTLLSHIDRLATGLRWTREAVIAAALKTPSLLNYDPHTLLCRVPLLAETAQVTPEAYLAAAARAPSLLAIAPETLAEKIPLLLELAHLSHFPPDLAQIIARQPQALTYSPRHVQARMMIARLGLSRAKLPSLLILPSRTVDRLLVTHFRDHAGSAQDAKRIIKRLRQQRIIRSRVRHSRAA